MLDLEFIEELRELVAMEDLDEIVEKIGNIIEDDSWYYKYTDIIDEEEVVERLERLRKNDIDDDDYFEIWCDYTIYKEYLEIYLNRIDAEEIYRAKQEAIEEELEETCNYLEYLESLEREDNSNVTLINKNKVDDAGKGLMIDSLNNLDIKDNDFLEFAMSLDWDNFYEYLKQDTQDKIDRIVGDSMILDGYSEMEAYDLPNLYDEDLDEENK